MPLFVLLDPMAIFNGFFSVFFSEPTLAGTISLLGFPVLLAAHLLFPGVWCAKLCPLGGLQVEFYQIKKQVLRIKNKGQNPKPVAPFGRRLFLASGLGIVAGLALPQMLWTKTKNYFKPPGAVPGGLFDALCIRCGNCIKSCNGHWFIKIKSCIRK
jgi:ferredoxin